MKVSWRALRGTLHLLPGAMEGSRPLLACCLPHATCGPGDSSEPLRASSWSTSTTKGRRKAGTGTLPAATGPAVGAGHMWEGGSGKPPGPPPALVGAACSGAEVRTGPSTPGERLQVVLVAPCPTEQKYGRWGSARAGPAVGHGPYAVGRREKEGSCH